MPAGSKKGERRGGRKKGTPNKFTGALKDMVLQALDKAEPGGGVAYLTKQAKDNPTAFMTLLGKVLPLQVTGQDGGPVTYYVVSWADAQKLPDNATTLDTGVRRGPESIASPKAPPLLEHEPARPEPVAVTNYASEPSPNFGSPSAGNFVSPPADKTESRPRVYTVPAGAPR